jgi:hypothetical protein
MAEDVMEPYDKIPGFKTEDESCSSTIPELDLIKTVLERAILDLADSSNAQHEKDAEDWFLERGRYNMDYAKEDTARLFSYRGVCNALNLDYIHIRELAFSRRGSLRRFRRCSVRG